MAKRAALLPLLLLGSRAESGLPLFADDECAEAPGEGRCGLNALQAKSARLVGGGASDAVSRAFVEVGCHDAQIGEKCFKDIQWAKSKGIRHHPDWYPGLTASSPDQDFQRHIHSVSPNRCPEPCGSSQSGQGVFKPKMPLPPPDDSACLCVFDIDRTLTARQGSSCNNTETVPRVYDNAYFRGTLILSELAVKMKETFCGSCYLGLCSHGNANHEYSQERKALMSKVLSGSAMKGLWLKPESLQWSDEQLLTPYVVYSPDAFKQFFVERIRMWYQRQGINIPKAKTWFFDDRADNVLPFRGTGMNARQISCSSRDMQIGKGTVGFCGATVAEVVKEEGVVACPGFEAAMKKEEVEGNLTAQDVSKAASKEEAAYEALDNE